MPGFVLWTMCAIIVANISIIMIAYFYTNVSRNSCTSDCETAIGMSKCSYFFYNFYQRLHEMSLYPCIVGYNSTTIPTARQNVTSMFLNGVLKVADTSHWSLHKSHWIAKKISIYSFVEAVRYMHNQKTLQFCHVLHKKK